MNCFRSTIGKGFLLAVLAGCMLPMTTYCEESPSYQLMTGEVQQATQNGLTSESYRMNINAVTWRQLALTGKNYNIVPVGGLTIASSAVSSTSSSESSSSSDTSPPSNRRPRPEEEITPPASPSSQSSSSLPASHGAASPEDSPVEPITSPEEPASSEPDDEILSINQRTPTGRYTFFDATETPSDCISGVADRMAQDELGGILWIPFLLIIVFAGATINLLPKKKIRWKKHRSIYMLLVIIMLMGLLGLLLSFPSQHALAAENTPQAMVYNGQLLNGAGQPVTETQSIRFSFWQSSDAVSGDTTETGAVNQTAPSYAGWQETHMVTPDVRGYFSVDLGTITPLPNMTSMPATMLASLFLQVDVKPATAPDTSYELLDTDPTNDSIDRSGMLSVPFALNADRVDQRHVGTGSGDIVTLGSGGILPTTMIPGGTDAKTFTLDIGGDGTDDPTLQFGSVLRKTLTYSVADRTFRFNDSVAIEGNLTVSGLINGMDLNNILGSSDALRASSGGGLNVNIFGGSYRLNGTVVNYPGGSASLLPDTHQVVYFGSGGLTVSQSGFPTVSAYIPLAEVLTSPGSVVTITDRRVLQSDDRERSFLQTFTPSYEKVVYEPDGNDNVGQLSIGNDDATLKNFYRWTSTRETPQDYDIVLRVPVPVDFARWSQGNGVHPLTLEYRSTSDDPADNMLSVEVFDTAGSPVTLSGATANLASAIWQTTALDFGATSTWTSGQDMVIRLKVSAKQDAEMHLGTLRLSSVSLNR